MRLALVATPLAMPDSRPAPGSLDGDLIRSRLPLPDAGFRIVDLDPAVDLAEQLELLFEHDEVPRGAEILFYASTRVILSVDGELFLCFDPASPDTGDSLGDLALVLRERATGPVAFVLECRHALDAEDPFRSAAVVGAAKEGVASAVSGMELLVAAQLVADESAEDRASPLTRALIEALDEADAGAGLTIGRFFATARESPLITGTVPCFAHVRGRTAFELLPVEKGAAAEEARERREEERREEERREEEQREEERPADLEPEGEHGAKEKDGVEAAGPAETEGAVAPPVGRAPYRSEVASIPVEIEEAPVGRAPYRSEVTSIPVEIDDDPPVGRAPYRSVEVSVDLGEVLEEVQPEPPSARPAAPVSETRVQGAAVLPEQRSFVRKEAPLQRVILGGRPPPTPPVEAPPPEPARVESAGSLVAVAAVAEAPAPKAATTSAEHVAAGDALRSAGDGEGALAAYKRALGMLGVGAPAERAEIYVRQGQVKQGQDKRREAIANFEKALALKPPAEGASAAIAAAHLAALEALLELNVAEGDWRAVAASEERVLATLRDDEARFAHLVQFGGRWLLTAGDSVRARAAFERAREIRPDDPGLLEKLRGVYEQAGAGPELLATRRRLAEITREPRLRATRFFELGQHCLHELHREELGLELLDHALESDPTMLDPLALVARVLADRQEWSELERAYRRMLERVDHIPKGPVRSEVTWELCRRLGVTFRDHLEDPSLALDAFEDAVHAKPGDLATRLTAAEIARSLGKNDRAAVHLEAAAALEPGKVATYHDLFEVFQKLRRPDQAYEAACVTMFLRHADARERFIFEEHKPQGVSKPAYALPAEAWGWLRQHDRDTHAEAVLDAITPACIAVRIAQLAAEGRLPDLDPASRQDPEKSTVSIVRSFAWASHFLGVAAPDIYIHDDPQLALASVIAEAPTVLCGNKAMRGRSLAELAFLVGRHLAYHVGSHRLLLYFPSIEELTACFLAAIRIIMPEVAAPATIRASVMELERGISLRITDAQRAQLAAAVAAFESQGSRANLAEWVAAVERCVTRAGYLLAGDLDVAAGVLGGEPRGVLEAETKLADLLAFAVSEEHHALREAMGVAIQP